MKDIMDERLRASLLYDYYGLLLNENQRELCMQYLFDDLSLREIADGMGISRQGVHDKIRRSIKQMEGYEKKLSLIQKSHSIEKELEEMKTMFHQVADLKLMRRIEEKIKNIKELT